MMEIPINKNIKQMTVASPTSPIAPALPSVRL